MFTLEMGLHGLDRRRLESTPHDRTLEFGMARSATCREDHKHTYTHKKKGIVVKIKGVVVSVTRKNKQWWFQVCSILCSKISCNRGESYLPNFAYGSCGAASGGAGVRLLIFAIVIVFVSFSHLADP